MASEGPKSPTAAQTISAVNLGIGVTPNTAAFTAERDIPASTLAVGVTPNNASLTAERDIAASSLGVAVTPNTAHVAYDQFIDALLLSISLALTNATVPVAGSPSAGRSRHPVRVRLASKGRQPMSRNAQWKGEERQGAILFASSTITVSPPHMAFRVERLANLHDWNKEPPA